MSVAIRIRFWDVRIRGFSRTECKISPSLPPGDSWVSYFIPDRILFASDIDSYYVYNKSIFLSYLHRIPFDIPPRWSICSTQVKAAVHLSEIASSPKWSNECIRTKIRLMTLPCKEATVVMAQELEQPISVKPNLTAENGKPFQGDLECIHTAYHWFTARCCA